MGNYIKWIIVGHKRTKIQTSNILDRILITDAVGQLLIGTHFIAQFLNAFKECRMIFTKLLATVFVAGIQNGSIGKYDACR